MAFKAFLKKTTAVFLSLCGPACGICLAAGTVTGEFMLTAVPAREAALGNIFAANYAKPSAATANPAALAGIKKAHIMLSHFMNVFNTFFEQIIYASPLSEKSWLQGYFMFSGNYDVYITDGEGNPVAQADSYDALLGAAYAFELTKDISLGLNARVVTGKSYAAANWGLALNAGFLYRNFDRRYMIGLSAENLGISTAYFVDQSMYPVVLRAGYNTEIYRYEESYRISLAVEERLYVNEQEGAETTFGLEAEYERFFVFRYGYIFGKAEGRVALGAGIKFKHINIDYAYQPYFFSDNAHRFTLEFVF